MFDAAWQAGLAMGALTFLMLFMAPVWPPFGRYRERPDGLLGIT